jgi:hypothetical protein
MDYVIFITDITSIIIIIIIIIIIYRAAHILNVQKQ